MLLDFASFSRDDMLRKVIWDKEKLSVVLQFAQMIAVCPNACRCDTIFGKENMHTQLREKFTKYEL